MDTHKSNANADTGGGGSIVTVSIINDLKRDEIPLQCTETFYESHFDDSSDVCTSLTNVFKLTSVSSDNLKVKTRTTSKVKTKRIRIRHYQLLDHIDI